MKILSYTACFLLMSGAIRAEIEFGNGFGVSTCSDNAFDSRGNWGLLGGGAGGFMGGGGFSSAGGGGSSPQSFAPPLPNSPQTDPSVPPGFAFQWPDEPWSGTPDGDSPNKWFQPPANPGPLFGGHGLPGELDNPGFPGNGPVAPNQPFLTTGDGIVPTLTPVPEPATYGLIASAALIGIVIFRSRRNKTPSVR